jgi:uncharacterized protein YbjT (DUF2867 family)
MSSILVVGATGIVGGEIAVKLRRKGHRVAALLRQGSRHPKAQGLIAADIAIIEGDITDAESLATAVHGFNTVVCTATSMPSGANDGLKRVDLEGTLSLIETAERARVKRFVYVSYSGNIREDSPLETAKRDCESRLLVGKMQAILLRPSYFMEMWLSPALGFDPIGGTTRIYGSGEAKVSYISSSNVADFAVAAATGKYSEKDTILEMGGPKALSQREAARIFERKLKKKIKLEYVPVKTLEAQHKSADPLQKTFGALTLAYSKGDIIPHAAALAKKYKIKLRSISEYAASFCGKSGRKK